MVKIFHDRFYGIIMANKAKKYPENVPGKFYVDKYCIACDACVGIAPDFFRMNDLEGHAYVSKQPLSVQENELCGEAMEACPVNAIGNDS